MDRRAGKIGYRVETNKIGRQGWNTKYAVFTDQDEAKRNAHGLAHYIPNNYVVDVTQVRQRVLMTEDLEYWYWMDDLAEPIYTVQGQLPQTDE